MQVDVVQTGAGVDHAIVDDAAFEVQHPEQFAGLHWHAMNRDVQPAQLTLGLIPGGIARLTPGPQQPAPGAEPVDHDGDLQAWPRGLGLVQGIQHFLASLILLQVQRDNNDAPSRRTDALEQAGAVSPGIGQHLDRFGGHGIAWQARQHGFGVH